MLTSQDIDVLLEAVEAWERKDGEGRMMGSLIGAMVCGKDEVQRAEWERKEKENSAKYERDLRARKDRSIMLRAKLIQMRDGIDADSLMAASSA